MPPKQARNATVAIKPDELVLLCEWSECADVFNDMDSFTQHVSVHLMEHLNMVDEDGTVTVTQPDMQCYWRECNGEIDGETADYLRHVYFHTFHVKIKCIGALLLEKTGCKPCMYDSSNRNLIPDLPESLECGWEMCQARFENAEMFYRHVQNHADGYPDGNNVRGGCRCCWEGCNVTVKSKHKLKDHFKSHTQEKLVGCPTCGALFSCRTKFFDHLTRQPGYSTGKQYRCSHCNRTFGAERLLRDHMRSHVNQYKCPFCDMTSPSPSNMRLHIKYRHSEEKPHRCDLCEYRCKAIGDLKKHIETHAEDEPVKCEMPDCTFKTKSFRSLEAHIKRIHQNSDRAEYQCHVCESAFSRGALLTHHLKKKHKFNWPAGHSRFRYKRHSDGKYRLQTVRYESVELTTHEEPVSSASPSSQSSASSVSSHNSAVSSFSHNSVVSTSSSNASGIMSSAAADSDGLYDMPMLTDTVPCNSGGIILVEKLNNGSEDDDGESVCLVSVIDASGQKKRQHVINTRDSNDANYKKLVGSGRMEIIGQVQDISFTGNNNSNAANPAVMQLEQPIEIRIVKNEKGHYVIESDSSQTEREPVPIAVHENVKMFEETYNLQMLGDVALQDQAQSSGRQLRSRKQVKS